MRRTCLVLLAIVVSAVAVAGPAAAYWTKLIVVAATVRIGTLVAPESLVTERAFDADPGAVRLTWRAAAVKDEAIAPDGYLVERRPVDASGQLAGAGWTQLAGDPVCSDGTCTLIDSTAGERSLYRVRATAGERWLSEPAAARLSMTLPATSASEPQPPPEPTPTASVSPTESSPAETSSTASRGGDPSVPPPEVPDADPDCADPRRQWSFAVPDVVRRDAVLRLVRAELPGLVTKPVFVADGEAGDPHWRRADLSGREGEAWAGTLGDDLELSSGALLVCLSSAPIDARLSLVLTVDQ
jgi:hypothetical protein